MVVGRGVGVEVLPPPGSKAAMCGCTFRITAFTSWTLMGCSSLLSLKLLLVFGAFQDVSVGVLVPVGDLVVQRRQV